MASLSDRLRPRPVAVFVALTLLIWTNRIWLAWTNDEDTVAQKLLWSTPITLFVLASVYLLVRMLTGRARTPSFAPTVRVFAVGTIVYWAIRVVLILTADHAVGFKAVHTVLAIVSVAAAAVAFRSIGPIDREVPRTRDGGRIGVAG